MHLTSSSLRSGVVAALMLGSVASAHLLSPDFVRASRSTIAARDKTGMSPTSYFPSPKISVAWFLDDSGRTNTKQQKSQQSAAVERRSKRHPRNKEEEVGVRHHWSHPFRQPHRLLQLQLQLPRQSAPSRH